MYPTARAARRLERLYQLAMLETDPAKLPPLMPTPIKRFLTGFKRLSLTVSAEHERLSDALSGCVRFAKRSTPGGVKPTATALASGNRTELAEFLQRSGNKVASPFHSLIRSRVAVLRLHHPAAS